MISTPEDVFTARETHGRILRPANRIIAQSQDAGWRSLFAAIMEEAPFDAVEAPVGHPFLRYMLARRIERAKELLRNTQTPIAEVAFSSGFSSQSHLSHWFLKLVGVSPATYRRQGLT